LQDKKGYGTGQVNYTDAVGIYQKKAGAEAPAVVEKESIASSWQ
jgi:hypothetical protein